MLSVRTRMAISLLVLAAGCVTVDGTLKADGSGTLRMSYQMPLNGTESSEKRRFTSPHVTVTSFKTNPDMTATVELSVDDVTKLSTASAFQRIAIARAPQDATEKVTITIDNVKSVDIKEDRPGPTFDLQFPGKVVEANRSATVTDNHVKWAFPSLREFAKQVTVDLVARYERPSTDQTTAPTTTTAPGK